MNLPLPRLALAVATLLALMLTLGSPPALGGPGSQRAFVAHLQNTERAVGAAEAKLEDSSRGVVGASRSIAAQAAALAACRPTR